MTISKEHPGENAHDETNGLRVTLRCKPLMTMLDAAVGVWKIDAPLAEILTNRGFGNKDFDLRELRHDLCCSGVLAFVSAKTEIEMIKLADYGRRKISVITDFLKIVDGLGNEISDFDHLLSKFPEMADQQQFENLQRFQELGEAIRPIANKYINSTDVLDRAAKAGATKHEEKEFFKAMLDWWSSNVTVTWKGHSAVRDSLAGALWIDLGGRIPKVKSRKDEIFDDQDEKDWAKEQFKLLRKKQRGN